MSVKGLGEWLDDTGGRGSAPGRSGELLSFPNRPDQAYEVHRTIYPELRVLTRG